ncbi:YeeE/YedE family protein [Fusobacteria bacterium ZRK30]|nr:YeeE/YedE family protein [Fusobacteria bacterium ZRK30]
MKKGQNLIGLIVLILTLIIGKTMLSSSMLFFRLLTGAGFGYALTRGFMGFAGSVNRAYNTGSTKLMRILAYMFLGTSILSAAFLYNADASSYDLWVNQVNSGLILGGIMFGFGMTFSVCCASGVLTDVVTGFSRGFITLIFFGMGVFLGFPFQRAATWVTEAGIPTDWIRKSWFTSETGSKLYNGVYFPDLFKWDGLDGYLGAVLLTSLLCGIVVYLSKKYESSRRVSGTFTGVPSEIEQVKIVTQDKDSNKEFKLLSEETYTRLFVTPWSMKVGASVIAVIFTLLMGVTKAGWGASTPYGWWFGRFLMIFGISPESLSNFTNFPVKFYTMPFFDHPINVQNVGIMVGTVICLLLAGTFKSTTTSEIKITPKQAALYAMGGILMGLGTRLANGCNVGALYTPIANFSLSGWVFFAALVGGGILGNRVAVKIK